VVAHHGNAGVGIEQIAHRNDQLNLGTVGNSPWGGRANAGSTSPLQLLFF
jgi:hypothetical protein